MAITVALSHYLSELIKVHLAKAHHGSLGPRLGPTIESARVKTQLGSKCIKECHWPSLSFFGFNLSSSVTERERDANIDHYLVCSSGFIWAIKAHLGLSRFIRAHRAYRVTAFLWLKVPLGDL